MTKNKICEVKESPIHGNGLFALCDIEQGVALFETHIMEPAPDGVPKEWISWNNLIPNCMYNHSKTKANCISETDGNRKILVTKINIKAGEELLADYTKDPDNEQPTKGWNDE